MHPVNKLPRGEPSITRSCTCSSWWACFLWRIPVTVCLFVSTFTFSVCVFLFSPHKINILYECDMSVLMMPRPFTAPLGLTKMWIRNPSLEAPWLAQIYFFSYMSSLPFLLSSIFQKLSATYFSHKCPAYLWLVPKAGMLVLPIQQCHIFSACDNKIVCIYKTVLLCSVRKLTLLL